MNEKFEASNVVVYNAILAECIDFVLISIREERRRHFSQQLTHSFIFFFPHKKEKK